MQLRSVIFSFVSFGELVVRFLVMIKLKHGFGTYDVSYQIEDGTTETHNNKPNLSQKEFVATVLLTFRYCSAIVLLSFC